MGGVKRVLAWALACAMLVSLGQVRSAYVQAKPPELDSAAFGSRSTSSLTVHKFHDIDRDGSQGAGEPNVEMWYFELFRREDRGLVRVGKGTTNTPGNITFTGLEPGRYLVWEALPKCWEPTTPEGSIWGGGYEVEIDLEAGQQVTLDFGNVYTCPWPDACIDLEKTGPESAYPGDTITYHYWVKNCGEIFLGSGAYVYDLLFGEDPLWNGDLWPGDVYEFDMSYTLPDDSCDPFVNHAWALGHPPGFPWVRDDDTWTIEIICEPEPAPAIDVEKLVNVGGDTWYDADQPPGPEATVGSDVRFRMVVTNTGNVPLSSITLADTDFDVSGCVVPPTLDPDVSFECPIGPVSAIVGQHTNVATATGVYSGTVVRDEDAANYYGVSESGAAIDVSKYLKVAAEDWQDADEPPGPEVDVGGEVRFLYVITNTGVVTLTNITLIDTIFDVTECTPPEILEPDEVFTCDMGPFVALPGQHVNTATACGEFLGGSTCDQDSAYYFGTGSANLILEPDAVTNTLPLEIEHPFTATVTDGGGTPLVGVSVSFTTTFGYFVGPIVPTVGRDGVGGAQNGQAQYIEVATDDQGRAGVRISSVVPGTAIIRAWLDLNGDNAYAEGEVTDEPSIKTWIGVPPQQGDGALTMLPDGTTVLAGERVEYRVLLRDVEGNVWDVTDGSVFFTDPAAGGTWTGNVYVSDATGSWTVFAEYQGLFTQASLRVVSDAEALRYRLYMPLIR